MLKRLSILGATGSIGQSTLEVARRFPERFQVTALAASHNAERLEKLAREFRPHLVALNDLDAALWLKRSLAGTGIEVLGGPDGVIAAAAESGAELVVAAIVGAAGLPPTLEAIAAGKDLALANKETLVMAGALVMDQVREKEIKLLPVDSEHSAIFQSLAGQRRQDIRRLILTASGGPFRSFSWEELNRVTPEAALHHPRWNMGPKITIDSATLMNKGLEVIEAHFLFGVAPEAIDVVIHPESVIHSMVEFVDGAVIAQMGVPDMKEPIAYALAYPERLPDIIQPLDFTRPWTINFQPPEPEKFPALELARSALRQGGLFPAALNAANEVAVHHFLNHRLSFPNIVRTVEAVLNRCRSVSQPSLEDILAADLWARENALEIIGQIT